MTDAEFAAVPLWRQIAKTRGLALDGGTLLGLMAYKAQVARSLIHEKTYAALPGASELVRGLWRHYPLAIVTGALREEVELMLEGIALREDGRGCDIGGHRVEATDLGNG